MKANLPMTIEISEWHTPATDYPEGQIGDFRIYYSKQPLGYYRYWGMDGYLFWRVKKPIRITNLQEKRDGRWEGWMVDDPPQQRAMEIYAVNVRGKVLVAGLGLGLILHELAKNVRVKEVDVVERSKEVIKLMLPNIKHLVEPKNREPIFTIINDDFYNFIEDDAGEWDCVIVDLWVSHGVEEKKHLFCQHVLPLHLKLVGKYAKSEITYHGFQTVSVIKPVSAEMAELLTLLNI